MSLGFKIYILVVEMAVDIGHFPTEKETSNCFIKEVQSKRCNLSGQVGLKTRISH